MNNEILKLLSKYRNGTTSQAEFAKLKQWVNNSSDEDLSRYLMSDGTTATRKSVTFKQIILISSGIAAILIMFFSMGFGIHYYNEVKKTETLHAITIRTNKGERVNVTLPDGSSVRLNSTSTLSYQPDFGKENRSISLSGEGYFAVAKNEEKPFIIHTECMDISVLGTIFNVYAYEYDNIVEVTLVNGSVKISTNTEPVQTMLLCPNQKAVFSKTSKEMRVVATNTTTETAWEASELVFRSEPLREVLEQVGRKYGVLIRVSGSPLLKDNYTGVFDEARLSDVLEILGIHYDFTYKLEEDTVTIHFNKTK